MKRKAFLLSVVISLAFVLKVSAQDYQQQINDCNVARNKLLAKLNALKAEKKTVIEDFQKGLFCSDCKRSRTEMEKSGTNFNQHIQEGAKSGRRVVSATAEQIQQKNNDYNNKINSLESDVDGKRLDCDRISANYAKAAQQKQQDMLQAQQKAQADAQKKQQDMIQAQQKVQIDAQQQAIARAQAEAAYRKQQQEAAQLRAQQEAERLRAIEAQKQAARDASMAAFQDNVNNNNLNTQARLDEHRNNSSLDDVPKDNYRDDARNLLSGTKSSELGNSAFDKTRSILRAAGTATTEAADYLRTKMREAFQDEADNARIIYTRRTLFGSEFEAEELEYRPSLMTRFKKKITEDLIQKAGDRILNMDGSGRLRNIYNAYKEGKADKEQFEDGKLTTFNNNFIDHITRGIDRVGDDDRNPDWEVQDEKIWGKAGQNIWGVFRNWTQNGKKALIKELEP